MATQNYFKAKNGLEIPSADTVATTSNSFPTIRPTLNLDFANSKTVDERITFTRSSKASYYDAKGVLQYANADEPRIDHDPVTGECKGLLIEEQRTNLAAPSTNIDSWVKEQTTSGSYIVAPDGSMTARKMVEDTSTAYHRIRIGGIPTVTGTTYTISIYAKASGRQFLVFNGDALISGKAAFDLVNGTATTITATSASITPVGNGWYRCSMTNTATLTQTTSLYIGANTSATDGTYTGDGSSGIYLWGAQVEVGAFATSYIPSTDIFTSRASSATYFDSAGTMRTAGANQARYGYTYDIISGTYKSQGLILESTSVTNLHAYSSFTQNSTITNAVLDQVAPDGSACYRAESILSAFNDSVSQTYVQSFYIKKYNWRYTLLSWSGVGPNNSTLGGVTGYGGAAIFDFDTGTFTSNRAGWNSQAVGNGWFRVWCSYTNGSTYSSGAIVVNLATDGTTYTPLTGYQVIAWGGQHELGVVPTSYIPAYSAATTRAADVSSSASTTRTTDSASINLSGVFNSKEGTLLFNTGPASYSNDSRGFWSLDSGSVSVRQQFLYANYATSGNYYPSTMIPTGYLSGSQTGSLKNAFAYDASTKSSAFNGNTATTINESTSFANTTTLRLGYAYATLGLNAPITKVAYYPKRLNNTELQALTK